MNYKIDDIVLYGTDGVCRISDVTERKIGGDTLKYLILMPVYNSSSTIFVPLANEKLLGKMRMIPSEKDLVETIERASNADVDWIENDLRRKEEFHQILDNGDTYSLVCLLKSIYKHQSERMSEGKKLHVVDERIMKEAEKVLCDEASYSLGINRSCVGSYIREKLGFEMEG